MHPASILESTTVTTAPPVVVIRFNYGEEGHGQVDYKLPPTCYKCKGTNHTVLLFPDVSTEGGLGFSEYALDDLDFFHMNTSMAEAASSLLALITIRGGKTSSPAIITNELQLLFCLDWDYEVTPVLDHEFTAVFSDPISLRYATRSEEITLTLNSFTINIKVSTRYPTSLATLSTVWIRIRGLPQIARNNGVIRSMFKMLGMIIEVDLTSLVREKIVCAKVKHRAPSKLQATIWMFFNDNRI
ncbi:hypothetical protein ZWY2020_024755 [Hordeum vulgare]|nr:hypothetical protein ZWY2020_024755 [Hordeum vulgare]